VNHHSRASSLLLIELILSVFIFALAGIFCVRLFAGAHRLTSEAGTADACRSAAQNMAELFIASDGRLSDTAALADASVKEDGAIRPAGTETPAVSAAAETSSTGTPAAVRIYYSDDWTPAAVTYGDEKNSLTEGVFAYCCVLTAEKNADGMVCGSVNVLNHENKLLYHLDVNQYAGKEAAGE
jgi:hypothetical protein